MAVLIHWFPQRQFVFLGDGGYASHDLARFCPRHRRHATLVSRFHGDACLYAPPPQRRKRMGRPRLKGRKLPTPEQVVARRALRDGHGHVGTEAGTRRVQSGQRYRPLVQGGHGSSRYDGSSSATCQGPIAMSTSIPQTHRSRPSRSSVGLQPAGRSRRPFRKCVPIWALRRPATRRQVGAPYGTLSVGLVQCGVSDLCQSMPNVIAFASDRPFGMSRPNRPSQM